MNAAGPSVVLTRGHAGLESLILELESVRHGKTEHPRPP